MTVITDEDYVIVECALHSDVVKESARGLVRSEVEKRVGALVDRVWEQVCRDALVGTFAEFSEALFGKSPLTFARLRKTAEAAASIILSSEPLNSTWACCRSHLGCKQSGSRSRVSGFSTWFMYFAATFSIERFLSCGPRCKSTAYRSGGSATFLLSNIEEIAHIQSQRFEICLS